MGAIGRVRDESASEKGTLFHAKMANHWNGLPIEHDTALGEDEALVLRAGRKVIAQEGDNLREQGIIGVEVNLDGDDAEAARHGRYPGTCDLITYNADRGLTITDYKTKKNLDAKYVDAELRETQRSWQLKQYAWFTQLKYNRPVTHVRKLLVAFAPALKVWLATYPITQHELSAWYTQAQRIWALMDEVEELDSYDSAWQNDDSCERYTWQWRCAFYETCWDGAPIEYRET